MNKKESLQQFTAVGMLIFGCTLTAVGFFMEPQGEVSSSVMWILGQCLIYAGSVFGLKAYIDTNLRNHERDNRDYPSL